jgi:small conductance mechanosensitive channel
VIDTAAATLQHWIGLPGVRALLVLAGGLIVVNLVAREVQRRVARTARPHWGLVASRVVGWSGVLLVGVAAARTWGLDLTAVLATAGVATVAVGFAAQTSLSNLIAGLFLLIDRPFDIGDTIEMEGRVGSVQEITLMSTLVRTFDNLRVRWPNEVVLKSTILNYSRYKARRVDVRFPVPFGGESAKSRALLVQALRQLPTVLLDPEPDVVGRGFVDRGVDLEARVWVRQQDFLKGRTQIVECIDRTLAEAGLRIAWPQVVVHRPDVIPAGAGGGDGGREGAGGSG